MWHWNRDAATIAKWMVIENREEKEKKERNFYIENMIDATWLQLFQKLNVFSIQFHSIEFSMKCVFEPQCPVQQRFRRADKPIRKIHLKKKQRRFYYCSHWIEFASCQWIELSLCSLPMWVTLQFSHKRSSYLSWFFFLQVMPRAHPTLTFTFY